MHGMLLSTLYTTVNLKVSKDSVLTKFWHSHTLGFQGLEKLGVCSTWLTNSASGYKAEQLPYKNSQRRLKYIKMLILGFISSERNSK